MESSATKMSECGSTTLTVTLVVSEEGGEAEEREERGERELYLMYLYPQKAMMSSHLSCETTASR